ncbi:MAG: hypothetical protein M3Q08_18100 [Pseudomonadota bacterium]|nr:hypothetical protein [Pseudomonadota bacterium]
MSRTVHIFSSALEPLVALLDGNHVGWNARFPLPPQRKIAAQELAPLGIGCRRKCGGKDAALDLGGRGERHPVLHCLWMNELVHGPMLESAVLMIVKLLVDDQVDDALRVSSCRVDEHCRTPLPDGKSGNEWSRGAWQRAPMEEGPPLQADRHRCVRQRFEAIRAGPGRDEQCTLTFEVDDERLLGGPVAWPNCRQGSARARELRCGRNHLLLGRGPAIFLR